MERNTKIILIIAFVIIAMLFLYNKNENLENNINEDCIKACNGNKTCESKNHCVKTS